VLIRTIAKVESACSFRCRQRLQSLCCGRSKQYMSRTAHAGCMLDNGRESNRVPAVRGKGRSSRVLIARLIRASTCGSLVRRSLHIYLLDFCRLFGRQTGTKNILPERERNITGAMGRPAETRMDIGSPTWARTRDLRINSP
jgi:hypothetical protein